VSPKEFERSRNLPCSPPWRAANPGDRVTLVYGVQATYGSGLTPTTPLYLSGAVPGGLTDVVPVAGAPVIA